MDPYKNFPLAVRKHLFDDRLEKQEKLGNVLRKCSIASTNLRKRGNKLYANKHHDKIVHENILSLYSESIAFAPVDSEELALAYGNRSALLLHLHHPKKSLIDIAKALEITKSMDLRTKLLSRKSSCLKLVEKSTDQEDNNADKLDLSKFTPSKQVPCAADCVKIDYNEQFGRHMIATRDIEAGKVIIAETALAVFPNGNQLYLNCSHCLSLAWNGIPCDFCAFAIFCSELCKKEAWDAYHDIECGIIPYVFMKQEDKSCLSHLMIATRIFIIAVKREGLNNILHYAEFIHKQDFCTESVWSTEEFNCATFRCYYKLLSHDQDIIRQFGYTHYMEAEFILNLLYKNTSIFSTFQNIDSNRQDLYDDVNIFSTVKKILIKLKNIISMNSYGYQIIEDNDSINNLNSNGLFNFSLKGILLAPCSSYISHSCYPNVRKMFMPKRKIVMFSVLPVKKGEQLYCCYGPSIVEETQKRQTRLHDDYYFTCRCEACKNNWTLESFNEIELISMLDRYISYEFLQDFLKLNFHPHEPMQDWPVNTEAIKEVATLCKLLNKHFKKQDALLYSYHYSLFLKYAFMKLYQEKRNIPNYC